MSQCQCQAIESLFDQQLAATQLERMQRRGPLKTTRLGFEGRVHYHYGNFVELTPDIPPADIVTLDRVICCFDDMAGLVGASADKAHLMYGLVYPRDAWWARLVVRLMNLTHRIRGNQFRVFTHRTAEVEALLERKRLVRGFHRVAGAWQVSVFDRKVIPA